MEFSEEISTGDRGLGITNREVNRDIFIKEVNVYRRRRSLKTKSGAHLGSRLGRRREIIKEVLKGNQVNENCMLVTGRFGDVEGVSDLG